MVTFAPEARASVPGELHSKTIVTFAPAAMFTVAPGLIPTEEMKQEAAEPMMVEEAETPSWALGPMVKLQLNTDGNEEGLTICISPVETVKLAE
jgi:hypothetical protein